MPTINTTEDSRPLVPLDMACTAGDDEDREPQGPSYLVEAVLLTLAIVGCVALVVHLAGKAGLLG